MDVVQISRGLHAERVLEGYRQGIFPMGYPGRSLITWHRPGLRAILPLDALHVSRSLERRMRKPDYRVSFNEAFAEVMAGCAARHSTWITREFVRVYCQLHHMGHAHSVEAWLDGALAGGLYGVQIGGAFFAESKFHRATDMSKIAVVSLARRLRELDFALLEVQYRTEHLSRFGVIEVPDAEYRGLLQHAIALPRRFR